MNDQTTQIEQLMIQVQELQSTVANLNTQVALCHSMMRAMEQTNNQLVDIAFDENKFTQQLLDRVDETAREAARDSVDAEEIARDAAGFVDVSDDVERCIERMGLQTRDDVNDLIRDYINDESIPTMSEVEDLIEEHLVSNDYMQREDIEDLIATMLEQKLTQPMEA
jgi:gamma-glutamyl:cysteine ligase YbdK (ATP-grasp superfamily)